MLMATIYSEEFDTILDAIGFFSKNGDRCLECLKVKECRHYWDVQCCELPIRKLAVIFHIDYFEDLCGNIC